MAIQDFYTTTMDVYGHTEGRSVGGLQRTATVKTTGEPCRRESSGASQTVQDGILRRLTNHTVFTDYADVDNGDDLVIEGITIRVTGRPKRSEIGNMPTFYRIDGVEVEN